MDAKHGDGLFFSSLDKTQSISDGKPPRAVDKHLSYIDRVYMERLERLYGFDAPLPSRVETVFRHSGWATDRVRVLQAMERSGVSDKRVARFCGCGGEAVVEWSPSAQRHRVKAFYCGDRFCLPCAKARSLKVKENLLLWLKGENFQFSTYTLRASQTTLSAMLTRIIRCFAKVRESVLWRVNVKGGAYVVEIKRGEGSGCWHVHLHVITIGGGCNQPELRRLWRTVTGDSHQVDVQDGASSEKSAGYVAKYACKGWAQEVLETPDDLDECLAALRGRRLLGTFGDWRGRKLERQTEQVADWRLVGRLNRVCAASLDGEPWAVGTLRSLGVGFRLIEGAPVFASPDPEKRRGRRRQDGS